MQGGEATERNNGPDIVATAPIRAVRESRARRQQGRETQGRRGDFHGGRLAM
jgi:hypothetical protein